MAITLDTTLVGTGGAVAANSFTMSNFSTGGTNRLVLVLTDVSQDTSTVSSVTATGLTFSKFKSGAKQANQGNVEIWGAWAASQQTNVAITVNFANLNSPQSSGRTEVWSGGADGTTIANAFSSTSAISANGNSTSPSVLLTTAGSNSQVVAAIGQDSTQTVTAGSNQTVEGSNSGPSVTVSRISAIYQNANTTASSTAVTMNATLGGSVAWGIVAVELLAGTSSISVSDTLTTSESTNQTLVDNPAVSDTATISESSSSYSDQIFTRESIVVSIQAAPQNPAINVSDTITTSENISLTLTPLLLSTNDSLTASESTKVELNSFLIVSDTATTSESSLAVLQSNVSASDTATLTESVQNFESINLSVSDNLTLTESISGQFTSFINVSDSSTLSDTVNIAFANLLSVSDTATLSESIAVQLLSFVSRSDTLTISETTTELIPQLFLSVSDTITSSESALLNVGGTGIAILDNLALSESVQMSGVPNPNVNDSLSLSESTQLLITSFVNKSDTATLTENMIALIPTLLLTVSDQAALTENVALNEITLVNASDNLFLSENNLETLTPLLITVFDTLNTSESINTSGSRAINTSDSLALSENVNLGLNPLLINVTSTITLTEQISVGTIVLLLIQISDSITINESRDVSGNFPPPVPYRLLNPAHNRTGPRGTRGSRTRLGPRFPTRGPR